MHQTYSELSRDASPLHALQVMCRLDLCPPKEVPLGKDFWRRCLSGHQSYSGFPPGWTTILHPQAQVEVTSTVAGCHPLSTDKMSRGKGHPHLVLLRLFPQAYPPAVKVNVGQRPHPCPTSHHLPFLGPPPTCCEGDCNTGSTVSPPGSGSPWHYLWVAIFLSLPTYLLSRWLYRSTEEQIICSVIDYK